jgi:hypothetical protein
VTVVGTAAGIPVSAGTLRLIVIGLGLSGFTSFAYEIYWARALVFLLGNSTYALSTMLTVFLTGIALGGYGIRLLFGRVRDLAALYDQVDAPLRLRQALAAEDRYLAGFLRFLQGMPLDDIYRVFDDALAVAPWNDILRARIYAQ